MKTKPHMQSSQRHGLRLWLMLAVVTVLGLSFNPRPVYSAIVVPPQWTDPTFDTPITIFTTHTRLIAHYVKNGWRFSMP